MVIGNRLGANHVELEAFELELSFSSGSAGLTTSLFAQVELLEQLARALTAFGADLQRGACDFQLGKFGPSTPAAPPFCPFKS